MASSSASLAAAAAGATASAARADGARAGPPGSSLPPTAAAAVGSPPPLPPPKPSFGCTLRAATAAFGMAAASRGRTRGAAAALPRAGRLQRALRGYASEQSRPRPCVDACDAPQAEQDAQQRRRARLVHAQHVRVLEDVVDGAEEAAEAALGQRELVDACGWCIVRQAAAHARAVQCERRPLGLGHAPVNVQRAVDGEAEDGEAAGRREGEDSTGAARRSSRRCLLAHLYDLPVAAAAASRTQARACRGGEKRRAGERGAKARATARRRGLCCERLWAEEGSEASRAAEHLLLAALEGAAPAPAHCRVVSRRLAPAPAPLGPQLAPGNLACREPRCHLRARCAQGERRRLWRCSGLGGWRRRHGWRVGSHSSRV